MDFTLTGAAERFGVGTTVSCYLGGRPPADGGAPDGNALTTAVVQASGVLFFTGLAPNRDYVVYAASPDRYMRFFTGQVPDLPVSGVAVVNLKDYAGDVFGGNWSPVLQSVYDTGRPIYAPEGTYDLEDELSPGNLSPRIFGAGKGRTIFRQQASVPFFSQYKNGAGDPYAKRESLTTALTTADVLPGASVIHFDTTGYAGGDYVLIKSTRLWPLLDEGAVYGELARIKSIDSSTQATLYGAVDEQYLLADAPTITKLDLLRGLHLQDFSIENPNQGTLTGFSYGVYPNYCLRPVVKNVEFRHLDSLGAAFAHCVDFRAIDLDSWDLTDDSANNRYGYGVKAAAGSSGLVRGCHMDVGRHSFTTGASSGEVIPRHVTVDGCTATRTTSYCFHNHNTGRFIKYVGCHAYKANAPAYNNNCPDTRYQGCTSENTQGGWISANGADRLRIDGCEVSRSRLFSGAGGRGADIDSADAVVSDFIASDCEGTGVVANTNGLRAELRNVRCYRTETTGGTKRGISVLPDGCKVIDPYAEDVDYVVYWFNTATNGEERGTRGRNVTNLRGPNAATFAQFQGPQGSNGQVETRSDTLAFTLTPGVAADHVLLTGVITADRGVTLSKTNAVKGMKYRITRTAAATGAFNRNIDNGSAGATIKALAVSQWCEAIYDGTNWVLTAFGSL